MARHFLKMGQHCRDLKIPNNQITLLQNGEGFFPAVEAALDRAVHDIYLETYIFKNDAVGRRIAKALERAALRGVKTHVLVDGYGSFDLPKSMVDDLEAAGAMVLKYCWNRHGDGPAPLIEPRGRMRSAFMVRDNIRHRRDIEDAYLRAIEQAEFDIIIANAFFFPELNFRHALLDAAARGVRVVLLLQGKVEHRLLHYASHARAN